MSSFERYRHTSQHYDATRVPIGRALLLDALGAGARALSEIALLDAGCGTGAYAASVAGAIGSLDLIDLNAEMLARAGAKLGASDRQARLCRGRIDALPYREASFDAVMINQVLHHLGGDAGNDGAGDDWRAQSAVLNEVGRVLRPGGVLALNTCDQRQLQDGFWFYALIPEAVERMAALHVPFDRLRAILATAGFEVVAERAPLDEVIQGEAYFDFEGPLKPEVRAGDSIWATARPDEIARAETELRDLIATGGIDEFIRQREELRLACGQITFLTALKRDGGAPEPASAAAQDSAGSPS